MNLQGSLAIHRIKQKEQMIRLYIACTVSTLFITNSLCAMASSSSTLYQTNSIKECKTIDAEKGLNPNLAFPAIYTALMGKPALLTKETKEQIIVSTLNEAKICSIIKEYCGNFLFSDELFSTEKNEYSMVRLSDAPIATLQRGEKEFRLNTKERGWIIVDLGTPIIAIASFKNNQIVAAIQGENCYKIRSCDLEGDNFNTIYNSSKKICDLQGDESGDVIIQFADGTTDKYGKARESMVKKIFTKLHNT